MEQFVMKIPYDFVKSHADIGWEDVRFGLTQGLLDDSAPMLKALDDIGEPGASTDELFALIAASRAGYVNDIMEIVSRLASSGGEGDSNDTHDRWTYLALAWLYERRDVVDDPLTLVEAVYADFGYPSDVASFVGYMPDEQPAPGSPKAKEARLYERWGAYLREKERLFHKKRG